MTLTHNLTIIIIIITLIGYNIIIILVCLVEPTLLVCMCVECMLSALSVYYYLVLDHCD